MRSAFDILFWLTNKTHLSGRSVEAPFLMKMLYFCQAVYAAHNPQQKLMPATFLATDAGPIEPNMFLALENNFRVSSAVSPPEHIEGLLESVWRVCKDKSLQELDLILSQDSAIRAAASRGRNSEITLNEMADAYKNGWPASGNSDTFNKFPDGTAFNAIHTNLDAAPNSRQEVRFTADGRSVTKWLPSKRVVRRKCAASN